MTREERQLGCVILSVAAVTTRTADLIDGQEEWPRYDARILCPMIYIVNANTLVWKLIDIS
jgi:hypothetical protein